MEHESQTPRQVMAQNDLAIPGAIVIAGLAIAAALYFGDTRQGNAVDYPQGAEVNTAIELDPVTEKDHYIGNVKGKVVIVEYSDTECPFCKTFHQNMQRIMSEYASSGEVAWVYRHFPLSFHTKAPKEAEATECANKLGGNTKFWEYTNKLFEITPANNGLDASELPKIAEQVGLDVDAFNTCLNSGEMKPIVDAGLASGAKAGVSGTPHSLIVVKGKVVGTISGAQPYEAVKAQLDEILK